MITSITFAFCCTMLARTEAENITKIDVETKFGISQNGIAQAINHSKTLLAGSARGFIVELYFKQGEYHINMSDVLMRMDDVGATGQGSLLFQGAGMYSTIFILNTNNIYNVIDGRNTYRVTWRDMTFDRYALTTTQGSVYHTGPDYIVLSIQDGFPNPNDLNNSKSSRLRPGQGQWLRRYNNTDPLHPEIITDNRSNHIWPELANLQVEFANVTRFIPELSQPKQNLNLWRFNIPTHFLPLLQDYTKNQQVGVKYKHGGQAFNVNSGDSITFERIRWRGHSRGDLRKVNNVKFLSCVVEKHDPIDGVASFLATPGGGPQIGNCQDEYVYNVTFYNHSSDSTGDDSIALFNVKGANVSNNYIKDSFCRGILLASSIGVTQENTLIRCPLWNTTCDLLTEH
eukprot:m.68179 g.68179  ORF g.68179 m.68179 type:complete len:400 (-) comp11946_c0_seq4:16-1215(-)